MPFILSYWYASNFHTRIYQFCFLKSEPNFRSAASLSSGLAETSDLNPSLLNYCCHLHSTHSFIHSASSQKWQTTKLIGCQLQFEISNSKMKAKLLIIDALTSSIILWKTLIIKVSKNPKSLPGKFLKSLPLSSEIVKWNSSSRFEDESLLYWQAPLISASIQYFKHSFIHSKPSLYHENQLLVVRAFKILVTHTPQTE